MSSKIVYLISSLNFAVIFVGFLLESWGVTIEYFIYKTSSVVTIKDYPNEVIAPSIALCARFDLNPLQENKVSKLFGDYFNDHNDSWRIGTIWSDALNYVSVNKEITTFLMKNNWDFTKLWSQHYDPKPIRHDVKKYLKGNKYCLLLMIKDKFKSQELFSPQLKTLPYFYRAKFSPEPFFSKNNFVSQEKPCRQRHIYINVLPDMAMIPSDKIPSQMFQVCTHGIGLYIIYLTYSELISIKLPPPYETNCRDYTEDKLLSSYDCYDKCLKKQTKPFNILLEGSVIDRKEYLKSEFEIAPLDFVKNPLKLKQLRLNSTNLFNRYRVINERWKNMTKFCQSECNQPDCVSHRITPQVSAVEEAGMDNKTKLTMLVLTLRITDHPILHISFVPKQNLIDYIIYMSSGLSFWLGFCPLTIAGWIEKKTRKLLSPRRRKRRRRRMRRNRSSSPEIVQHIPTDIARRDY